MPLPLCEPLGDETSAWHVFQRLAELPGCLFLDSALTHPTLGRYSYVMADPIRWIRADQPSIETLGQLHRTLETLRSEHLPDLPPFQGGWGGVLSYDFCHALENLPRARLREFSIPLVAMAIYDVVVAIDHVQNRGWILSHGWPERDNQRRRQRAADRLNSFKDRIHSRTADATDAFSAATSSIQRAKLQGDHVSLDWLPRLQSNFSRLAFESAVEQAIRYIHEGDLFQVNLAQRLVYPAVDGSLRLYERLRQRNAATFASYFDMGDIQIASASPERFLFLKDGRVSTRPIKGTRPRFASAVEANLFNADTLRASEKDKAENVMIVDLMRNDLSRVCLPDSVVVEQLCQVETYQYVQHLVSSVQGELRPGCCWKDLVIASFPGGSITGAPKVRAMQRIAELERHARGFYCGSLGYIDCNGGMDLNILIRTITVAGGWWQFPVGGGIVAQSNPQQEYEETRHKAEGILKALAG